MPARSRELVYERRQPCIKDGAARIRKPSVWAERPQNCKKISSERRFFMGAGAHVIARSDLPQSGWKAQRLHKSKQHFFFTRFDGRLALEPGSEHVLHERTE